MRCLSRINYRTKSGILHALFGLKIHHMQGGNTERKDGTPFHVGERQVTLRHDVHADDEVAIVVAVGKAHGLNTMKNKAVGQNQMNCINRKSRNARGGGDIDKAVCF